jgi:phage-related protein
MNLSPEQTAKVTAVGALIADLLDGKFKERLGISSPSRVMAQHGADIIQGLINGLYNSMGGLSNVISRITYMFDTLRFGITNNLSGALSALSNFGMQASALINNATSVISNGINSVANMISNLTNTVKTMPSTVNSGGLSLLPGSGMTVTYVPQPVTSGVTNITTSYTYSPTFASTPDRATRDANTTLYNVWKYSPKAVG